MGDSWEDEEFEVSIPVATNSISSNWEDETDELENESTSSIKPIDPVVLEKQKEALKKKEAEEAIVLANKVKAMEIANETPEQKRIREKQQAEGKVNYLVM
jgi:hypothetical protein